MEWRHKARFGNWTELQCLEVLDDYEALPVDPEGVGSEPRPPAMVYTSDLDNPEGPDSYQEEEPEPHEEHWLEPPDGTQEGTRDEAPDMVTWAERARLVRKHQGELRSAKRAKTANGAVARKNLHNAPEQFNSLAATETRDRAAFSDSALGKLHGTHALWHAGGFLFCTCCGGAQSRKGNRAGLLPRACRDAVPAGAADKLKKLRLGKLPSGHAAWPDGSTSSEVKRPQRVQREGGYRIGGQIS
jgi:hypothetical protein